MQDEEEEPPLTLDEILGLIRSPATEDRIDGLIELSLLIDSAYGEEGAAIGQWVRQSGALQLLAWLVVDSSAEVQQQSLVETQRATLAPLRQTAQASRIAVALLLGQPAQTIELKIRRVRSLRVPKIAPGLPATLLVRRPDIRDAERQLASAEASVEVARKAFLPTIQLTGQAGYQSAALNTLLRPESFIYNIAAGITQPIFDGGRLRGQLALSEAQRQQLLETYRKRIVTALSDVETALVAVRETQRREAAQRVAVIAARRAFQLSEERLQAGTIDLTSLLTIQNTLFQAEDTLVQIRLARLQAAAALFQALGGDWDDAVGYVTE